MRRRQHHHLISRAALTYLSTKGDVVFGNRLGLTEVFGWMCLVPHLRLRDEVLFVVIMSGDGWAETTLIRQGQEPNLEAAQIARVVSWSGRYDRTVVVP
jgi:hypothetical protein